MIFEEVTFNISLRGKFNLERLQRVFETHRVIDGGWVGAHGVFTYKFETEIGVAEIDMFAFDSSDYAKQVLLKIAIATPPQFINTIIEFINELASQFSFSISAYEIRMLEGYKFGSWYNIEDYAKLGQDYQEIHDLWRETTDLSACKTSESMYARNCITAQIRQKRQPITIILCPPESRIGFAEYGGSPDFGVVGTSVDKDIFYNWIENTQLEQGQISGIQQKIKTIPPSPNGIIPRRDILVEVIQLDIDEYKLEVEIHLDANEQISWIDYELEFGTESHIVKLVLQCLIELAMALDWHIIEGFDFRKFSPVDLDIHKLIELVSMPSKRFST